MDAAETYPRRPRRLDRLFQTTDSFYFVTFNTYRRQPVLASQALHATFHEFVTHAAARGAAVGRYVIMPDHVHLFVMLPPEGMRLGRWMQSLKAVLGKTLSGQGHAPPHWQEGFFDHVLRSGESYSEKWQYVRDNPVRKRLVEDAKQWPYQGEIVPIMWHDQ